MIATFFLIHVFFGKKIVHFIMHIIRQLLREFLHCNDYDPNGSNEDKVNEFANAFKNFRNVIVMCGAGLSTAAGIPDFRSPSFGIYAMFSAGKANPESLFAIDYFMKDPVPFYTAVKKLLPKKLKPTKAHYFIRYLQDMGILRRVYTQNIDGLERVSGIEPSKIVEAHGSFATSHCTKCSKLYNIGWLMSKLETDKVPRCDECKGVIKPDIVLFGEALPVRFYQCLSQDANNCDCIIIMGTSLSVQPFASAHLETQSTTSINKLYKSSKPLGSKNHSRQQRSCPDIFLKMKCDDGADKLAEKAGFKDELNALYSKEIEKIQKLSLNEIIGCEKLQ